MNTVALRRKLIYLCAIVALIIPIRLLGEPAIRSNTEDDEAAKSKGGALARIRAKHDLGQADLGQIDPASESMRLATLGLRGVACTILWTKAEEYKKEKYWDRLSATLNQIAVLQPHFIKVWEFQSHNLSYNVSTEFDNYKHRYDWVKKGIDYLITGSRYNKHRTELPYELGWFFGNKMGIADEKIQYRELYREDEEFHEEIRNRSGLDLAAAEGLGPDSKPDNWKSGRLWYERAYAMVRRGDRPARSTMMFYRMGPQWLMKHAEWVQRDRDAYEDLGAGGLDAYSRQAWRNAERGWTEFGDISIDTSFGDIIRLGELKQANEDYARLAEEFKDFCGETYLNRRKEKEALLEPEQLAALDIPYEERTFEQVVAAETAQEVLTISPTALAKEVPEAKRIEALELAKNLENAKDKINHIEIYQNQINYVYWAERCRAEQKDDALEARRALYEAEKKLELGELDEALEQYDLAWENWDRLFNRHPALMVDEAGEAVMEGIDRYRRLLDEPNLPDDFPLKKFMEFHTSYSENTNDPALMGVVASWPDRYPDRNFLDEMSKKNEKMKAMLAAEEDAKQASETKTIDVAAPSEGQPPVPAEEPASDVPEPAEDATDGMPKTLQVSPPANGEAPAPAVVAEPKEEPVTEETPAPAEEPDAPQGEEKSDEATKLKVNAPAAGSAPSPDDK